MTTDIECKRCGTCCREGGPALHRVDHDLVASGKIPLKDLYTIRKEELARDNVKGTLQPVVEQADALLVNWPPGSKPNGGAKKEAQSLTSQLAAFNSAICP